MRRQNTAAKNNLSQSYHGVQHDKTMSHFYATTVISDAML